MAAAGASSFLDVPPEHDFSLQNLPYGVFSTPHTQPRVGVAIGDWAVDLSVLADEGLFPECVPALALPFSFSLILHVRKKDVGRTLI